MTAKRMTRTEAHALLRARLQCAQRLALCGTPWERRLADQERQLATYELAMLQRRAA